MVKRIVNWILTLRPIDKDAVKRIGPAAIQAHQVNLVSRYAPDRTRQAGQNKEDEAELKERLPPAVRWHFRKLGQLAILAQFGD